MTEERSARSDLLRQRRANFEELAQLGVDPYPRKFERSDTIGDLVAAHGGKTREELETAAIQTRTAGRILAIRSFGKANFLVLSDGRATIQVYIRQDSLPERDFAIFKLLDFGDFVGVEGKLFRTKTNELTIWAAALEFLAKCFLPLPEKWHGLSDVETRYRQRYLDLIVNPDSRRVFQVRSKVLASIRGFLNARGYLEVETPMMQPIAGGALARPFVTHHNALDMQLFLRIAPELYLKRLVVGGLERVYEINRNFRNEGISTQHNPEFTMLEFYQAYSDYQELMVMTEEMLSACAREAIGSDQITFGEHEISLAPPYRRVSLREGARDGGGRTARASPSATPISASARPRRRSRGSSHLEVHAVVGRGQDRDRDLRAPQRARRSCSRPSSTTFRPKCRRSRSRSRTIPTRSSASSCTSAGSRWRTPSASSTIRPSSAAASRRSSSAGRPATPRRTRWTRTTSGRSSTACRRPRAKASASTAS